MTSWPRTKFRPSPPVRRVLGAAAVVVLVAAAGAAGAMVVEERDSACAGCHLPPEATYVARSRATPPADLAAAHAMVEPPVRCIDCHAGPNVRDRPHGLGLAAADMWSWVRGAYVVVGAEYAPLGTSRKPWSRDSCVACHGDVLDGSEFDRHFHQLLDDAKAPAISCVTCHTVHLPRPGQRAFLTDDDAQPGCDACHVVMGGPSSEVSSRPEPTPATTQAP